MKLATVSNFPESVCSAVVLEGKVDLIRGKNGSACAILHAGGKEIEFLPNDILSELLKVKNLLHKTFFFQGEKNHAKVDNEAVILLRAYCLSITEIMV